MKHFLLTLGFMLTLGVLSAFGQQTGNKLWLKASKVLLPTGGKVSFEVEGTNPSATYKYKWTLPKQFKKLSERGNKVVVKIPDEGNYEVKVFVESNDESDDVELKTNVEVSNSKKIELLSVGKKVVSCSGNVGDERPDWLFDGTADPDNYSKKWCAEGKKEHEVVVDLGQTCQIYRLKFYDCRTKETDYDNIQNFKLFVSDNQTDWTLALSETGNNDNVKDITFAPVKGRYVKFVAYDPNKDFTIRVWELELYGVE